MKSSMNWPRFMSQDFIRADLTHLFLIKQFQTLFGILNTYKYLTRSVSYAYNALHVHLLLATVAWTRRLRAHVTFQKDSLTSDSSRFYQIPQLCIHSIAGIFLHLYPLWTLNHFKRGVCHSYYFISKQYYNAWCALKT